MTTTFLDENPLRVGLRSRRRPRPATIVIFGATGDLTRRKLLPALFRLHAESALPAGFSIVGFARRDWDDDGFRRTIGEALDQFLGEPVDEAMWESFSQGLFFSKGTFDNPDDYGVLSANLEKVEAERVGTANRLFYLAAPPSAYSQIVAGLGKARLAKPVGDYWSRVIVEKPFGKNLRSARSLNEELWRYFQEDQIYRIDHYLGKETVQNILVFRLANGIFEPVWNRRYVDHVQISVAEDLGIGGRSSYYEEAGAVRDIIQNHVLQLLSLVAMEPPAAFDPQTLRDEKVKVLRSIRPLEGAEVDSNVVRGQYTAGLSDGQQVPGYRDEKGVDPGSTTETFVAMKVFVDTWRWAGVPFYLRAGKRLPKRVSEVSIEFKQPPLLVFGREAAAHLEPNTIVMRIQPDEGITLKFGSKAPGPTIEIQSVSMEFRYGTSFGERQLDAYERLILDSLLGDPTLFNRADSVDAAWRFVDPITAHWQAGDAPGPYPYEAGSWGPKEASDLIQRDGREWRRL